MADLFPENGAVAADTGDLAADNGGTVSFGRSWRFDYGMGEFVRTPTGKIAVVTDTDAWVEWCCKALQTERYHYMAYSRDYGQEFDGLIGSGLSRSAVESEIRRLTRETLMSDPRTAGVDDFSFRWEADRCYYTCTITNVRDETESITGSVVNS